MDLSIGSKSLVGLLDNNCFYAIPVLLSDNFAKDILALSLTNTNITGKPLTTRTSTYIPEGLTLYQVLSTLLLFGDHEIVQGEIINEVVHDSIIKYHPVAKS